MKFKGQPGIDGAFSDLASPKPEYDSECYGRYRPVVDGGSQVILEPAERVVLSAQSSGVSEYLSKGDDPVIQWAYLEPLTVTATNHRLYFHTLEVAGSSRVERMWMKRKGLALVGHFRWPWLTEIYADDGPGLSYVGFVGRGAKNPVISRTLLVMFGSRDHRDKFANSLRNLLEAEMQRRVNDDVADSVVPAVSDAVASLAAWPNPEVSSCPALFPSGF